MYVCILAIRNPFSIWDGSMIVAVYMYRPHLKDHGSVDISASGVSLSVTIDIKANKTNGHMRVKSTSCSFHIGSIKIDFHGKERSAT